MPCQVCGSKSKLIFNAYNETRENDICSEACLEIAKINLSKICKCGHALRSHFMLGDVGECMFCKCDTFIERSNGKCESCKGTKRWVWGFDDNGTFVYGSCPSCSREGKQVRKTRKKNESRLSGTWVHFKQGGVCMCCLSLLGDSEYGYCFSCMKNLKLSREK